MDQPGKVANPARGQLNRENNIPLSPCVPENLVSRDEFSRPVPYMIWYLDGFPDDGSNLGSTVYCRGEAHCHVCVFFPHLLRT